MGSALRVGLNLAYLVEDSGGSGRYARELIRGLLEVEPGIEITAWVGSTAPAGLAHEPWAQEVQWIRLPVPGIGSPWHLWHELAGIGLDARRRRIDVVHGLAYLAPVIHPGVATVVTILDVIWARHRDATSDMRFRIAMQVLAPLVGRSADRIIAISDAARDEVSSELGLDIAKMDVTPLGISPLSASGSEDPESVRGRLGLGPQPVVLCVAAKRAHKNLDGLIRGFALSPGGAQLVLPGSPTDYETQLRDLAAELGVQDSVHFPGWISDTDLEDLYSIASCFVLPTFMEGFGLPILEAMARGVPVACSDIPVLREVAGDAAVLFDPHDPASIAVAIERITGDRELVDGLMEEGRRRCAEFTWERTARATLASYRRALSRA